MKLEVEMKFWISIFKGMLITFAICDDRVLTCFLPVKSGFKIRHVSSSHGHLIRIRHR